MTPNELADPVEWVRRVNRTWIVHQGLAERAEEWLAYLESLPDGRFEESCAAAHAMSQRRDHAEDPKPWFYAGLFSTATAAEAKRFLASHRLTPATVPAMWKDEAVVKWIFEIGPETRRLLARLRADLMAVRGA